MTRQVITAQQDTPFKELVRLMHEHRVSGVPVVDGRDKLVGIVTEADLLVAEEGQAAPGGRGRSLLEWFIHPGRLAAVQDRAEDLRARDVMTGDVVAATPGMGVRDAVKVLLDAGVKRLPVVDQDGRVVGIVSRRDLLEPFLRSDEDIHREIAQEVVVGSWPGWCGASTGSSAWRTGSPTCRMIAGSHPAHPTGTSSGVRTGSGESDPAPVAAPDPAAGRREPDRGSAHPQGAHPARRQAGGKHDAAAPAGRHGVGTAPRRLEMGVAPLQGLPDLGN